MTIPWLLIFLGGLLGSGHCVGMCGGFVLTLGTLGGPAVSPLANLRRQVVYALGRIFTYSAAGAVVGYCGWWLERNLVSIINAQAILSILAGALLLLHGLTSAGVLRWPTYSAVGGGCASASLLGGLLRQTRARSVFLGGVINGLLPCGLVYSYLVLAASSGGMTLGLGIMAVFGLGTMPLMVLTGCGGSLLGIASRRRALQVAAWCVVLTGVFAIARGAYFVAAGEPGCPWCD
jgi:sulfite exporter TauE/SafE